jgi:hypothetical protein
MDRAQLLVAIIGSAAIGALISSLITELGRWRERKSRREELALAKATELSQGTYASSIELMKAGHSVKVYPQTMMVRDAYRMFKHLLDHGVLDPQTHGELAEELRADAEKENRPRAT